MRLLIQHHEPFARCTGRPPIVRRLRVRIIDRGFLGQDINRFDFDEAAVIEEQREAERSIASCMAEKGFEYIPMDVSQPRLNQLQPAMFGPDDPFEAAGVDPEEMSARELEEFYIELNRLDPESLSILDKIQADEIALARAVIQCGGGPLNEQVMMSEVRVEYEQAFLNENADSLAEFAGDS